MCNSIGLASCKARYCTVANTVIDTTVMSPKSPSSKRRDAFRMTQFNLKKKEDAVEERMKDMQQNLERKNSLIFKLELDISKLKFSSVKSKPQLAKGVNQHFSQNLKPGV